MRVAYLVNQYPGISHTFIRREIQALERCGVGVLRYTVRLAKAGVIAPEDKDEAVKTRSIVGASAKDIVQGVVRSMRARPARSITAFATAAALGWKSEAGLLRHFIYYTEAMVLASWLRDAGIAHVHAHFGTNSATVAMLAARIDDIGFSMTVHGPEEFDKAGAIGLPKKLLASRFTAAVSSYGASQLRRLIEPSEWGRIAIVRCGIEAAFAEGAVAPPPALPRLVSIGRLSPQKGQGTLIEAAGMLKRDGVDFSIVLVGDGEMRGDLEDAARKFDVIDRIVFAGWKTPAEVRAELLAARALVLPSYAEGLPVSIMEAFSLGRPVVSTYVAGIPELVTPGESGWLAPAGDAAALALAMREALAATPERLAVMGQAGKARVAQFHDIDVIAADLKLKFEQAMHEAPTS